MVGGWEGVAHWPTGPVDGEVGRL
eukprot:COSAG02_NODE_32072_length_522_cov_3.706856_1_plen_23_part_01